MKKSISLLTTTALLAVGLPLTTHAATGPCGTTPATQVYDLKTDWSDTQNPNGTWSYRAWSDGPLLLNDPFPWTYVFTSETLAITRTAESGVIPGFLERGDIFVWRNDSVPAVVHWAAPANGKINISGTMWPINQDQSGYIYWTLKHNGSVLSSDGAGGFVLRATRALPYNLASGSGGATALQNIEVQAGDWIELEVFDLDSATGVNFTIALTPDSAGSFADDAIIWHQPLARSGASEDTDPSAGRTVKYRFKRGSTIPIQIHALGCDGRDVTSNANVIGKVTVFGDSNCDGAADANAEPIEFNGVGGGGGVMDKIGGHLKYNVDTKTFPTTTQCYILRVTVTDTSTGQEKFEEVLLQAK